MFDIINRKVHVFDCDGVLLDSNSLKVLAMRETLNCLSAPYDFIELALQEFKSNFGRTRRDHLESFANLPSSTDFQLNEEKIKDALAYYSKVVVKLYSHAPEVNETKRFVLNKLSEKELFVVSASAEDELRDVLPSRLSYFSRSNIYGGPKRKTENLSKICNVRDIEDVVVYGDSVNDALAAMKVGVKFVGLTKYSADNLDFKKFCKNNKLLCFLTCNEINK